MKKQLKAFFLSIVALFALVSPALAARTTLTPVTSFNVYSGAPGATALDYTYTAADVANGNQWAASERDIVLIYNSGGLPYTVTIASVPDQYGRSGDISSYSVGAGVYSIIPIPAAGFKQSTGYVNINASNAAVGFKIVRLP